MAERFKRTLKYICVCQKCGCEFKSFLEDRKYCDKHRNTERIYKPKPLIRRSKKCIVCDTKFVGRGIICSDECRKKHHAEHMRKLRAKKGVKPRVKKEKVIIHKVEPLRIMDKINIEPKPLVFISPKVYKRVQTGVKTWIEFSSEERYLNWLNKQVI